MKKNEMEAKLPALIREMGIEGLRDELTEYFESAGAGGREQGAGPAGLIKIRLPKDPSRTTREQLDRISRIMKQHPGRFQTIVYLPPDEDHPGGSSFRTRPDLWADPDPAFRREIIDLVGEANYKD